MFRVTQYMKEIAAPTPIGVAPHPPGPVVIWNLVRRCNLTCRHCYSISADVDFPGELSTDEVYAAMDDLKRFGVRVLILSGGEPLLRSDLLDIARRAKNMGFYVGLSTNGTLIETHNVGELADIGFDYLGISLDGIEETHDRFRRKEGRIQRRARRHSASRATPASKSVSDFTLTQDNAHDLAGIAGADDSAERIDKFYLSHLNYAGRRQQQPRRQTRYSRPRGARWTWCSIPHGTAFNPASRSNL